MLTIQDLDSDEYMWLKDSEFYLQLDPEDDTPLNIFNNFCSKN